jgi:hypothetical protein
VFEGERVAEQMEPRIITIGKGTMLVDNEDFINGYQAGHLACTLDCRHFPVTNENVIAIFMEKLEDIDLPWQYGLGYCIGWTATLTTKGNSIAFQQQENNKVVVQHDS